MDMVATQQMQTPPLSALVLSPELTPAAAAMAVI